MAWGSGRKAKESSMGGVSSSAWKTFDQVNKKADFGRHRWRKRKKLNQAQDAKFGRLKSAWKGADKVKSGDIYDFENRFGSSMADDVLSRQSKGQSSFQVGRLGEGGGLETMDLDVESLSKGIRSIRDNKARLAGGGYSTDRGSNIFTASKSGDWFQKKKKSNINQGSPAAQAGNILGSSPGMSLMG